MMGETRVLAIIPAYNEAASIVGVARSVLDRKYPPGVKVDALVVDDGSTDDTSALCRQNGIPVETLQNNLGIGGAMQCGYHRALERKYDIAFQFDGDGQHDADCVDTLLTPILEDRADFVIGSRFLEASGDGFRSTRLRRLGIRWISAMLVVLSKRRITDPTSGFRAANARVIALFARRYPHDYPEPESTLWLLGDGYRVMETATTMRARVHGRSSIGALKSVHYMFKVTMALLIARFGRKRGRRGG